MDPLCVSTVVNYSYLSVCPSACPSVCVSPFCIFASLVPDLFTYFFSCALEYFSEWNSKPSHLYCLHFLDIVDTMRAFGDDCEVDGVWKNSRPN